MSGQTPQEKNLPAITESMVADYLREHLDFFKCNPKVLAELELSHDCGGATSFIEHQVNVVRQQNNKLRGQLERLVKIARDNDRLSERMHRLTLSILDADTLNDLYIALDESLRNGFQADAVTIKLFADAAVIDADPSNELMGTIMVPMDDPRMKDFKTVLSSEKPVCGRLSLKQTTYMFGEGNKIASSAVIPLGGDSCTTTDCPFLGVLVIGSRDANKFTPNMGTLFLSNLSEIVSRAIKQHIVPR